MPRDNNDAQNLTDLIGPDVFLMRAEIKQAIIKVCSPHEQDRLKRSGGARIATGVDSKVPAYVTGDGASGNSDPCWKCGQKGQHN